jgi:hypothetical protein
MLNDRPAEQSVLFKEISFKKLTVREAEGIARRIAYDKVRKKERAFDPEIVDLEEKLREALGTRVQIERRDVGGKIMIDFFSNDDLKSLLDIIQTNTIKNPNDALDRFAEKNPEVASAPSGELVDDRSVEEKKDDDMYSVTNFSI